MERGPQMANRIEGKAVDKTSIKHFIKLIRAAKPRYLFFIIGILAGIVGTLIQLQVPKMVQPLVNSFGHGSKRWQSCLSYRSLYWFSCCFGYCSNCPWDIWVNQL